VKTEIYRDTVSEEELEKKIFYYNNSDNILSEWFYLNNQIHRSDGPSAIYYYKDGNIKEEWYCLNGNLHRDNGPAKIRYNENRTIYSKEYWIKGKQIEDDLQIFLLETLEMELEEM